MITPFDLNVLCTPPAFILSQDQTLENIVSYHRSPDAKIYSRAFVALLLLFELYLTLFRIVRVYFALLCLLCTSLFVVQFSMTDPTRLSPRLCPRSRGDSIIISHCLPFVNTFFKTFLSFFRLFSFVSLVSPPLCLSARQLVYSITFFLVCQGVFKNFSKKFF